MKNTKLSFFFSFLLLSSSLFTEIQVNAIHQDQVFEILPLIFHPHSIDEIKDTLEVAKLSQKSIRCIDSTHRVDSDVFPSTYFISLDHMNQILSIEDDSCSCEGGVVIQNLSIALEKQGLMLPDIEDITEKTILDALMISTNRPINLKVIELELMDFQGNILYLTRMETPDLLEAALKNLDSIGILTKVKLKTVPLSVKIEKVQKE